MEKRYALVYQAGIANLFEVGAHGYTASMRGTTHRIYQGDFHTAAAMARGARMAGADVRTACCNEAGEIAERTWNCDYDDQPFCEQYQLVGGVI